MLEPLELLFADREPHAAFLDPGDELCRDVARTAEDAGGHGQAVEDVTRGIADGLLDLAELLAVRAGDLPAALDSQPGSGLRHSYRRSTRPVPASGPAGCPRVPRARGRGRAFLPRRAVRGSV